MSSNLKQEVIRNIEVFCNAYVAYIRFGFNEVVLHHIKIILSTVVSKYQNMIDPVYPSFLNSFQ